MNLLNLICGFLFICLVVLGWNSYIPSENYRSTQQLKPDAKMLKYDMNTSMAAHNYAVKQYCLNQGLAVAENKDGEVYCYHDTKESCEANSGPYDRQEDYREWITDANGNNGVCVKTSRSVYDFCRSNNEVYVRRGGAGDAINGLMNMSPAMGLTRSLGATLAKQGIKAALKDTIKNNIINPKTAINIVKGTVKNVLRQEGSNAVNTMITGSTTKTSAGNNQLNFDTYVEGADTIGYSRGNITCYPEKGYCLPASDEPKDLQNCIITPSYCNMKGGQSHKWGDGLGECYKDGAYRFFESILGSTITGYYAQSVQAMTESCKNPGNVDCYLSIIAFCTVPGQLLGDTINKYWEESKQKLFDAWDDLKSNPSPGALCDFMSTVGENLPPSWLAGKIGGMLDSIIGLIPGLNKILPGNTFAWLGKNMFNPMIAFKMAKWLVIGGGVLIDFFRDLSVEKLKDWGRSIERYGKIAFDAVANFAKKGAELAIKALQYINNIPFVKFAASLGPKGAEFMAPFVLASGPLGLGIWALAGLLSRVPWSDIGAGLDGFFTGKFNDDIEDFFEDIGSSIADGLSDFGNDVADFFSSW